MQLPTLSPSSTPLHLSHRFHDVGGATPSKDSYLEEENILSNRNLRKLEELKQQMSRDSKGTQRASGNYNSIDGYSMTVEVSLDSTRSRTRRTTKRMVGMLVGISLQAALWIL